MRVLVLVLVLTQRAFCVVNAPKIDKEAIYARITHAEELNTRIRAANTRLNRAKTVAEQQAAQRELNQLGSQRADAYNEAIYMALAAYQIIPPGAMPQGRVVARTTNLGKTVTWLPMFADKVQEPIVNEVGRLQGYSKDPAALGTTASDGVSRIYPEGFESADQLALLLVHEKVHFDQNVTLGGSDVLTLSEREVQAYSAERQIVDTNLFEMPDWAIESQKNRIEGRISEYEAKAKKDRAAMKKPPRGLPLPEYDIQSHTKDELDAIRRGASELRTQVEQERMRRLRSLRDPRNDLRELARRFCGAPGDVQESDFAEMMSILVSYCEQNSCNVAGGASCVETLEAKMFEAARKRQLYRGQWKTMIAPQARGPRVAPPMAAVPPGEGPKAAEIADPKSPSDAIELAQRVCRGYQVPQAELDSLLERLGTYMRRSLPLSSGLEYTCDGMLYNELCDAAHDGRALSARALVGKFREWQDRHRPQAAEPPPQSSTPSWNPGPDRPDRRTHTSPPGSNLDLDHAKETVEKEKRKVEECHWTDPRNDCWNKQ